jgi:translation initiation factor IF-3
LLAVSYCRNFRYIRREAKDQPKEQKSPLNRASMIESAHPKFVSSITPGEQVGVVDIEAALAMADEIGLDLVEIAPEANPPVCKIMDFGKFKYEAAQKAREARQNQTHIVVKEVRLTPKIEAHDYETKKNAIEKFLKGGDKVKITMKFRGREQTRPEMGFKLLQRLAEDVVEHGFVEFAPKQEGRNMTMVLGPTKKKTEAVAEQKAARAAAEKAKQEAEK